MTFNNEIPIIEKKKILVYAVIVFVLLFCFVSIFITSSYMDEQNYHYPQAQMISLRQAIYPGSNYASAYPPLPYLVANLALKINGSLQTLRFLNYVVFLLAVLFFYMLAKKLTPDYLVLTFLFFLNPYLLKASYIFLLYNWGLLFLLIALNIYFIDDKVHHLWADLFLLLAVLCQQWMLVAALAILLYQFGLYFKGKIGISLLVKSCFYKFIVLLPALFLFFSWRGLTHPNFASHSLHPTFEHLNAVLANVGLLMFFVVSANLKKILKENNALLFFPLPLLWLAIPKHSMGHGPQEITGIVSQLAAKLDAGLHIPYALIMFFFIAAGYLMLLLILKKDEKEMPEIFQYTVLGFFIAFTASARLAASHIYISFPLILLLFRAEIEKMRMTKIIMIIQFFLLSLIYIVYVVFFRSRGIIF